MTWRTIHGAWFAVKISVVGADVPLLLSRPALGALGMRYDIAQEIADFPIYTHARAVCMIMSTSGHPQVAVASSKTKLLSWPGRVDWSLTEICVPSAQAVYMADLGGQIFIPKKLSSGVQDMLIGEPFSAEAFLHWWRSKNYYRDFWIETPKFLYRIHVMPRRSSFDPRLWQT